MNALATPRFDRERALVAFLFFVVCPITIGFPMGWYQAGLGRFLPVAASCGLWISQWLISWWLSEALLRGSKAVFKPWQPSFLVLLMIAAISNVLLSRFWGPALNSLFMSAAGVTDQVFDAPSRNLLDPDYIAQLFRASAYGAIYWCVLRLAYQRYLDRRDSGQQPADSGTAQPLVPAPAPDSPWPMRLGAELLKVGIADPGQVIALQAEDHYVRVHLADGNSRLIYCRFADALDQLKEFDGLQVHRSFWVKRSAIVKPLQEGGSMRLLLTNGQRVPVSHKHRALLEFVLTR